MLKAAVSGELHWWVSFDVRPRTDADPAVSGWLVQRVASRHRVDGQAASGLTPVYWEAWEVDDGLVRPFENGPDGAFEDHFKRPGLPTTSGYGTIDAAMYFVPQRHRTPLGNMALNAVAEAKERLMSTTTEPPGLGPVLATRTVAQSWATDGTHDVGCTVSDAAGNREIEGTVHPDAP